MCEVGKRIRNRRIELGYSAEELAPMVGLSPATIYRYENGDIKKVSTNKVKPFAAALKTSEAFLMGWTDDPSEKIAAEESQSEQARDSVLSDRAMEIARAYDSMSSYGKSMIDKIMENEKKYRIMKVVPNVGELINDGTIETKEAAKKEQRELSQEENVLSTEKI